MEKSAMAFLLRQSSGLGIMRLTADAFSTRTWNLSEQLFFCVSLSDAFGIVSADAAMHYSSDSLHIDTCVLPYISSTGAPQPFKMFVPLPAAMLRSACRPLDTIRALVHLGCKERSLAPASVLARVVDFHLHVHYRTPFIICQ